MRVLMVTDFYYPYLGGVEQHVRSLSQELARRGHSVAVATQRAGAAQAELELDGDVRVYRIGSLAHRLTALFKHPARPWAPPVPDPAATAALARIVAAEKPEVVHGHDWLARSFLPLKPTSGVRFVVSLHYYTQSCAKKNLMYEDAPCSGPALAKCLRCGSGHYGGSKAGPVVLGNFALAAWERRAVDMFVAVSEATAVGNRITAGDVPYRIVPNFVTSHADVPGVDVTPYLAQLPAEPFLLFVGDLRRLKGVDVLLEAFTGLGTAPPLVLIGKAWPETPTELPPNVIVLRDWPNEAVREAWGRSLMGVVPSLWPEPFGIVVIEAMAAGRPVVGSRIGGIPDIVADGETGLLVPPADATALRGAIRRLLDDSDLRERMGQAAAERATLFDARHVVPQIESVYEAVLSRRSFGDLAPAVVV